jgi:hypothetical protein
VRKKMIDPELKYCPQCADEYMPVATVCAACKVDLISGREALAREEARQQRLAARGQEISAGETLVSIRQGPLSDLKHAEYVLRAASIPTVLAGDEKSCGGGCGCATNFLLQVRQEDVQDGLRILADDFRRATGLDHHDLSNVDSVFDPQAAEVACPACGYRFRPEDAICPDCGLQF